MTYQDLDRATLTVLAPELLVTGQTVDRPAIGLVITELGQEAFGTIAIEEWMGASPVYTRRIREALRITGDDISDIFKAVQFDVGAPPQLLDFQFALESPTYGEFRNEYCGALVDIEPMGHDWVRTMCHDIQDPTFDATAAATNPRARFRPIHRPPRDPADRTPHCHWKVFIDEDAEPLTPPKESEVIAATLAASVALSPIDTDDEGVADYTGDLYNNLEFGRWSRSALVRICEELALQHQLLALSFQEAVRRHADADRARDMLHRGFTGVTAACSRRLARTFGAGDDAESVAHILSLNPALGPQQYTGVTVETVGSGPQGSVRVTVPGRSAARQDGGWISTLAADRLAPLSSAAAGVHAHWGVVTVVETDGVDLVVDISRADEPLPEPFEVSLAMSSAGLTFDFEKRVMLPVVAVTDGRS